MKISTRILCIGVATLLSLSPAFAATVNYTMQSGNLSGTQGSGGGFHGVFDQSATEIGIYANSAGDSSEAAFETFTTSGVGSGTARALQVGDVFQITFFSGNNPFSRLGLALRSSTDYSSFSQIDSSDELKLQLDSSGGVKVYSGGAYSGGVDSGLGAGADETLTITITSANTFNVTIARSGGGTTSYYDVPMYNGNAITSFGLFLVNDNGNSYWKNGSLTDSGAVEIGTGNGSSTISGIIADGKPANSTSGTTANTLTKRGTGTISLTGNNSHSGGTYILNGVLGLNNNNAAGSGSIFLGDTTGNNNVTMDSSVNGTVIGNTIVVQANGNGNTVKIDNATGGGTVTFSGGITLNHDLVASSDSGETLNLGGIISGTGTLSKQGAGIVRLTGNNTYNGETDIDGGELWASDSGTIASGSNIYLGKGSTPNAGAKLFIDNTAGGRTFVNNINVNGGNGNSENREIGGLNSSGNNTFSGNIVRATGADNRGISLYATSGGTVTFSGVIDGDDAVKIRASGGTIVFGNNNTYTGNTEIDQGNLRITGDISDSSKVFIGSGAVNVDAVLALAGSGVTIGDMQINSTAGGSGTRVITTSTGNHSISGTVDLQRDLTVNATGGQITFSAVNLSQSGNNDLTVNNSSDVTLGGALSASTGASDLNKQGTGLLTVSGNNSGSNYKLNIDNGTVFLNNANALGNTANYDGKVNFANNTGTLQIGTDISAAGTNYINGVTGVVKVDPTRTFTQSGSFKGTGTLKKEGTGKLILSGVNAYTGGTIVNAGTLAVNGTIGSVQVNSGAMLQGSGHVGVISGAGRVGPGNSPGIMTATQVDPTLGTDYAYEFTQTGDPTWNNAGASGNDVLRLTDGTTPFIASLTSANKEDVFFSVATLTLADTFRGGFFTDKNQNFTTSVLNGDYHFYVLGDGNGVAATFNSQGYYSLAQYNAGFTITKSVVQVASANFTGGTVLNGWVQQFQVSQAVVSAVPEPSMLVLLLTGMMTMYAARRRNRKR